MENFDHGLEVRVPFLVHIKHPAIIAIFVGGISRRQLE